MIIEKKQLKKFEKVEHLFIDKLKEWLKQQWHLYASCSTSKGESLQMWSNCNGEFKVLLETKFLYEGNDPAKAIEVWNNV